MAAGDAYVVYPLDTVHHEMDSVNCSHSVYKSVWSPVISRSTSRPRKRACQQIYTMNLQCSNNGFSDSGLDSVGIRIYSHIMW